MMTQHYKVALGDRTIGRPLHTMAGRGETYSDLNKKGFFIYLAIYAIDSISFQAC